MIPRYAWTWVVGLLVLAGCRSTSAVHLVRVPPTALEDRYAIAVFDFENDTGNARYDAVTQHLADALLDELSKYDRFRIVERKRLEALLAETKLQMTGLVDESRRREWGRQLGADAALMPELISVVQEDDKRGALIASDLRRKTRVLVSARLVDLRSNEVLVSAKAVGYRKQSRKTAFGIIHEGNLSDPDVSIRLALEPAIAQLANDIAARTPAKRP